jgi:hypothetical protein
MVPWRLRELLRPKLFSGGLYAFRHGFRNSVTVRSMISGWGNEGWSADASYLEAVCQWASEIRGPILECGSGLSTVLLGIVAPGRVTSLEHLPDWRHRVRLAAARHGIHVNVVYAPLVRYLSFDWYSLPESLTNLFELVICDGPPSQTAGGRYGLLPVVDRWLARKAIILMDDIDRADERRIVARWNDEFGVQCEEHHTANGAYGVVRRGSYYAPYYSQNIIDSSRERS